MKTKIYHIGFTKSETGVSGGEVFMLEIIKCFKAKRLKNVLLTTKEGKEMCQKLGFPKSEFLEYKTIKSYQGHHIFISYILRAINAVKLIKNIKIKDSDILFCHSDFFPDSVPFYFLARKNKNTRLFYWFHSKAPGIFKGYEGQFTNKYQFPKLNLIYRKIDQALYRKSTFERGVVLNVNPYYEYYLKKRYSNNLVHTIKKFGGIIDVPREYFEEKKIYDLCWMGRFHSQKGLFELLEIVNLLRNKKKNIRAVVLGGGDDKIKKIFLKKIKENHLTNNIDYKGFISGTERYKYIQQARIFLMTSVYENLGTVNLEAMKCGLPIVAYNLPTFKMYNKGMIKIPILNNKRFVEEIIKLLINKEYYNKIIRKALKFSDEICCEKTGEEIYNLITNKSR